MTRRRLRGAGRRASSATAQHPTLGRRASATARYLPMVELLRYLEANGFTNYIASGGDRDFMRPITEEIYGIPAERVIGSSNALAYQDDDARRHRRLPGRDGLLRRRPDEAGPHLEPDRPTARRRGRQLQRRHPDAAVRGRPRAPACGCWCCTTTRNASSATRPGPRPRSSRRAPRTGPWSASGTTGRPSSPTTVEAGIRQPAGPPAASSQRSPSPPVQTGRDCFEATKLFGVDQHSVSASVCVTFSCTAWMPTLSTCCPATDDSKAPWSCRSARPASGWPPGPRGSGDQRQRRGHQSGRTSELDRRGRSAFRRLRTARYTTGLTPLTIIWFGRIPGFLRERVSAGRKPSARSG